MSYEKYKQEGKRIGTGQFGKVYKAINIHTNQYVALKRINKHEITQDKKSFEESLKREINNMKICKCKNSVEFYDFYDEEDDYVIIMELCDKSLADYIEGKQRPLSVEEIYEVFSNLNNVFKIMQEKQIVHRDLKNENILIKYTNSEKTKFIPKLCDFGFSKQIEDKSKTFVGSTYTIAPEIISGKSYDSKVDLWSIGVIIYFCCFGNYPYPNVQDILNLKKNIKLPYKKCKNIFLNDLIEKLLVIEPNERISWDAYFKHPFFTLSSLNEIDFGFKNNNLHYYKAKYKEDENKYKSVLIKAMNHQNLESNFYYLDYTRHTKFSKNNRILNLITFKEKIKDLKNNLITYFIYDYNENCEPLSNYCKNHNFSEKDIKTFINDFVDIFRDVEQHENLFISVYSFVVNPKGNILLCDFGLNKYFLSGEEMEIYYAPNKEELKNEPPEKTTVNNFGITLLKMINNNEDIIFDENKKFVLKNEKKVSEEIKDIISKCLNQRPNWNDLVVEEETLLDKEQFNILLDILLTKYKTINEYYSNIDINNMKFKNENEDFILLTIYEINKINIILSNKKEFTRGKYEISFLTILNKGDNNNNKIESQFYSINSKNCLDIYLINDNLCPEKKDNFIDEIETIKNNLINIILELQKITNNEKYEKFSILKNNVNDDYFENLLKYFGKSKFHKFFVSLIQKCEENANKKENIDKNKVCLEINISKYIAETLLFIKKGIKTSNDFGSKRYKTKEELTNDIKSIFSEGDENEKGNKYILISLFCENIRDNYDFIEHNNLEKDNDNAIGNIIQFYPNILKLLNFVKTKNN